MNEVTFLFCPWKTSTRHVMNAINTEQMLGKKGNLLMYGHQRLIQMQTLTSCFWFKIISGGRITAEFKMKGTWRKGNDRTVRKYNELQQIFGQTRATTKGWATTLERAFKERKTKT